MMSLLFETPLLILLGLVFLMLTGILGSLAYHLFYEIELHERIRDAKRMRSDYVRSVEARYAETEARSRRHG